MRIVVDAMGSDSSPAVEIEGAVSAANDFGYEIILVGDEKRVSAELNKHAITNGKITVRNATQVIEMGEPAAVSVRRKRDSSLVVAMEVLKHKEADSFVSAGNTGAVICAATLGLRLLPGVERPGIATLMPSLKGMIIMIDVGANIGPKPMHLFQYAIMGDAYSRYVLGKDNPSVGLLNIGEEESKGTDFVKETHTLLSESRLNFIGNVEGRDIYKGKADIIVCDGFVGNVILKVSESVIDTIVELWKNEVKSSIISTIGAVLSQSSFRNLSKKMDYSEYGGAPLLGVDGRCIICHGSSNAKAIRNAIKVAAEFTDKEVNRHIVEELESY